jgi:ornithine cyclodeaminase
VAVPSEPSLRSLSAEAIAALLDRNELVEALRLAFRSDATVPTRHHHTIARAAVDATLLLMPAWEAERADAPCYAGVKIVSVFPANAGRHLATVQGVYVLLNGSTGAPLALFDGPALTLWRTAAASALAASYLARADASHLVMIGAGALAGHLVAAHAAIRPIGRVSIWNRRRERAEGLAASLARPGLAVAAVDDLAAALGEADIVSAATLSAEPLVRGAALKEGAHVDLVGGFTPAMREADDEAIRRARVYVDTIAGAVGEAGDIRIPIETGVLAENAIAGDLFALCRGAVPGRTSEREITLFKSVGTALEDLAAAAFLWRKLGGA